METYKVVETSLPRSQPNELAKTLLDEQCVKEIHNLIRQMESRHRMLISREDLLPPRPTEASVSVTGLPPSVVLQSISSNLQQQQQQQANKPAVSYLQPTTHAVQILPSSVPDSTVIVPESRSHVAKAVLALLIEKGNLPLARIAPLMMRANIPFRSVELTWGDLREDPPSTRSRIKLYDLLKAGVSVIDLRKAHLVQTFEDLKRDFGFNPVDLTADYQLLNMSILKSFFGVTYANLAVDFSVGLIDYLIRLNLDLPDIASSGISIETMLNWTSCVREAFDEYHLPNPTNSRSMSSKEVRLLSPLTCDLFMERVRLRNESPTDWSVFMSMRAEHLIQLGITRAQLSSIWKDNYGSINTILTDIFNCSQDDLARIPNGTTTTTTSSSSIRNRNKRSEAPPSKTKKK